LLTSKLPVSVWMNIILSLRITLTVYYRDGVNWSGLYIAAANCMAMIQAQDEVDVVQTVLSIKVSQPHFINVFVSSYFKLIINMKYLSLIL